jgi:hypothetical protein
MSALDEPETAFMADNLHYSISCIPDLKLEPTPNPLQWGNQEEVNFKIKSKMGEKSKDIPLSR